MTRSVSHTYEMSNARHVNLIKVTSDPTTFSILVKANLLYSVKGVVHSVVRDLQLLGSFLHGIAFLLKLISLFF